MQKNKSGSGGDGSIVSTVINQGVWNDVVKTDAIMKQARASKPKKAAKPRKPKK